MTSFEKKTKLFYKELKNECNPDQLLGIAKQGIFLYEPLFKFDKINDHENVVEISIFAKQFFVINTKKQYEKLIQLTFSELNNNSEINPYLEKNELFSLIIINQFLIEELMKETNEEFISMAIQGITPYFLLLYFYEYGFISTKDLNLFSSNEKNKDQLNLKFEIFEHFYNKKYKNLLNKTIHNQNIKHKNYIMDHIIHHYGRDINIVNYCINKIKEYDLYIPTSQYQVPLFFPLKLLKKYTNKIFIPNQFCVTCEDKRLQTFLNTVSSDNDIKNDFCNISNKELKRYELHKDNFSNYQIRKKDIDLEYIYNTENYQTYLNDCKKNDLCIIDTPNKLIKIHRKEKEIYLFYTCNPFICIKNMKNMSFYRNYLKKNNELEKILNDPDYILNLKIKNMMCETEKQLVLYCYLISLVHNNTYNTFIINVFLHTVANFK
ncbi:hypothetical protein PIROE2DRAFT_9467 [Piromyces sp. E2]|nr:hypothetical protein PIROE2DRAFT_9467 [Piromyces sp. E2]|eukprot:OUM63935.1 hypothetical protein PIROE2DRAFT_9467 [Piromyces sp. E2]